MHMASGLFSWSMAAGLFEFEVAILHLPKDLKWNE